jgi:SDR family mycofactocin-dependent oxidoreductase
VTSTATSEPAGVDRPIALVTGAARGIGAATARRLAADGWGVVLADVCADIDPLRYSLATRADLDATVRACGEHAIGVVCDVRDQAQIDAAVAVAAQRFGGLDAAVAAAGVIGGGDPAWNISEEAFALNIDVNLNGVWRTAKAAIPAMLQRPKPRRGRFVAIASAAGMRGNPTIADYTAAKHGVVGLVRSLALELGYHGITANAVAPGSTTTAILQASADLYGLASTDDFAVHHTIGRNLDPDEIAAGVAWLCAADRGGVTGIVLPIDGGMTV